MTKKHPIEELIRNYFQQYLDQVFGAFWPNIVLGESFEFDPDHDYTEEAHLAYQVLFRTAKLYNDKLTERSVEEQRDFISRLQRECHALETNDIMEFVKLNGLNDHFAYKDFFEKLGIGYLIHYQKMVSNLSVISPKEKPVFTDNPESSRRAVRLNWVGNANTLYHLFAQLLNPPSGKPLIDNTAEDVVQFIKANIDGITANEKTIAAEISRHRTGAVKEPKKAVKLKKPEDT